MWGQEPTLPVLAGTSAPHHHKPGSPWVLPISPMTGPATCFGMILTLTLTLSIEQLEGLYRLHALDECGALLSLGLDDHLGPAPNHPIECQAQGGIQNKRCKHERREQHTVSEN